MLNGRWPSLWPGRKCTNTIATETRSYLPADNPLMNIQSRFNLSAPPLQTPTPGYKAGLHAGELIHCTHAHRQWQAMLYWMPNQSLTNVWWESRWHLTFRNNQTMEAEVPLPFLLIYFFLFSKVCAVEVMADILISAWPSLFHEKVKRQHLNHPWRREKIFKKEWILIFACFALMSADSHSVPRWLIEEQDMKLDSRFIRPGPGSPSGSH